MQITADLLIKCEQFTKLTDLIVVARLTHAQTKNYLDKLVKAGYLNTTRKEKRRIYYKTSEKGKKLLIDLKPALKLAETFAEE